MKKIGEVSPPFGWRAWPALIDKDSECCRAQRRLLTTRCHRYIIADKSNEGQDASLRIEMGNPNYNQVCSHSSLGYRPPAHEARIPATLT